MREPGRHARRWWLVLGGAVVLSLVSAAVLLVVVALGAAYPVAVAAAAAVWLLPAISYGVRHGRVGWRRPLIMIVAAAVLSLGWLAPRTPGEPAYQVPAGTTWLTRADGTRLALHVTRGRTASAAPVVFVHGGPGVSDLADDAAALAPLADRRDVYVYDQLGSGASSRLTDPAGYSTERALGDLGAIVDATGAERVVLVGHSWGARYALSYAARHSDRVAAVVLTSPGPPPVATESLPAPQPATRLGLGARVRLYAAALTPRTLFTYALATLDPAEAHRAAGDAEMDARFARLYRRTAPALFCDPAAAEQLDASGVGFYAYQAQQRDPGPPPVTLATLADLRTPVVVIRGACDYTDPLIADAYSRLVPGVVRIDLPDAGHLPYRETPTAWRAAVDRFLDQTTTR